MPMEPASHQPSHSPDSCTAASPPWPTWVLACWFLTGWAIVPYISMALHFDPLWPSVGFWALSIALACRTYGSQPTLHTLGLWIRWDRLTHWPAALRGLMGLILYAGLMMVLGLLFSWFVPQWEATTAHLKAVTINPQNVLKAIWVSPWLEELMFRGLILGSLLSLAPYNKQDALLQRITRAARPIVVVCLFFTLCHSQYTASMWALTYVFTQALILSISRVHTGSLWIPIMLHTLNNALSLL